MIRKNDQAPETKERLHERAIFLPPLEFNPYEELVRQILAHVRGEEVEFAIVDGKIAFIGTDQEKEQAEQLLNYHLPRLEYVLNEYLIVYVKKHKLYPAA